MTRYYSGSSTRYGHVRLLAPPDPPAHAAWRQAPAAERSTIRASSRSRGGGGGRLASRPRGVPGGDRGRGEDPRPGPPGARDAGAGSPRPLPRFARLHRGRGGLSPGLPDPFGQIALGEVLERTGRRWSGPARRTCSSGRTSSCSGRRRTGGLLCCPPQPREAYAPRIFRIRTGGTELRCTGRNRAACDRFVQRRGGERRVAECWRCLETTGSGSCGAILSSGFVPEE